MQEKCHSHIWYLCQRVLQQPDFDSVFCQWSCNEALKKKGLRPLFIAILRREAVVTKP